MEQQDEHKTQLWWATLSAIGLFNIALWLYTASSVDTSNDYTWWHLRLSGIYVVVCAYRSFLPRIDLERTTMVDHQISSVVFGRSGATIAEISFGAQVGLALHELGAFTDIGLLQTLAPVVTAALVIAQGFCWYGLVTLNHLGHAIEESIWGVSFAVVALLLGLAAPATSGALQMLLVGTIVGCLGYVVFMFRVDVPMYLARWRHGQATGETYMSITEGFADAWRRRVPTRSWAVWQPEVAWLTGYFSFAVWSSLVLVWLPRV